MHFQTITTVYSTSNYYIEYLHNSSPHTFLISSFISINFFIISTLSPSYSSLNVTETKRSAVKINRSEHFADWPIYVCVCNRCVDWLAFISSNWEPYSAMIQRKLDSIYPVQRKDRHRYTFCRKRYGWVILFSYRFDIAFR